LSPIGVFEDGRIFAEIVGYGISTETRKSTLRHYYKSDSLSGNILPGRRNERISFSFSKIRHGRAPAKKTGKLPVNHIMLSYLKCSEFFYYC
jgi:hypothetical protein